KKLGFNSDFSIYDEQDSKALMKQLLKELGIDSNKTTPQSFLEKIDYLKSQYILPGDYRKTASFHEQKDVVVYDEYQKALFRSGAMDFGDLLLHVVTLFKEHPNLLESYRREIRYILVDEYQDTNHVQYLFLTALGKPRGNVLVVGDDDQAIYSFRGANIRNILDFEKDFPGAKVVRLEENYRSSKFILRAANKIIEKNKERKKKELWTARDEGQPLRCFIGHNEAEEAEFICREILKIKNEELSFKDIAVFYRTNAQSRALEEALIDYHIPYRIFGGLKFYDRKEIKDLLAYLKLLVNPSDSQAFLRVINTPARGLGPKSIENIVKLAKKEGTSLMQAALKLSMNTKGLKNFVALIKEFKNAATSLSLVELIDLILDRTGYLSGLMEMKDPVAESRIDNIKEFKGVAWSVNQEGLNPIEQLQKFLDRVSLSSTNENPENISSDDAEFVSLMTLHLAKGLEFPVVFFSGMEEGLVPHYRSLESEADIEEERRLCYVGMTRAMNIIYLTLANTRSMFAGNAGTVSTGFYRYPSRFLRDIPIDCISEDSNFFSEIGSVESVSDLGGEDGEVDSHVAVTTGYEIDKFLEVDLRKQKRKDMSRQSRRSTFKLPDNVENGMRVSHPVFGEGVVDRIDGDPEIDSSQTFITVQFDDFDEPMKLVYKWSNLSRIN
ncbi:MAG: UvrD-helicase domain-containing protein, partial [SAR324 cluster bacterium]|nr:UvrD-helicase domain-containing protein [SAR324 cluster bacterium]